MATYTRRFVHFGDDAQTFRGLIVERAVAGAWFELYRRGGCGPGQLTLKDRFADRAAVEIGDYIAFEYTSGDRWYLGRVEERRAESPAGVSFQLYGMAAELAEVFPGGFGSGVADGKRPHRYARTDLFPFDPDHASETVDAVSQPEEVVRLLLSQYIEPATHITHDPADIEETVPPTDLTSLKFRGEESAQSIVNELAMRAHDASWGVRADGTFFFIRKRTAVIATFQEGVNLVRLEELRGRDLIYNRLLLTGDYVYAEPLGTDVVFRGFYRWRGNYIQPDSRDRYGERRIRLWVPWIRTKQDAEDFAAKFFAQYANPTTRYSVETRPQTALVRPWSGRVRLLDKSGAELTTAVVERVRVVFDHAPRFVMEIGLEEPPWPEPPEDERWEIPGNNANPGWGGREIGSSELQVPSSSLLSGTFDSESYPPTYGSDEGPSGASSRDGSVGGTSIGGSSGPSGGSSASGGSSSSSYAGPP